MPGYNYKRLHDINEADDCRKAIEFTVFNYFYHQLGWSKKSCKDRVKQEINREIPGTIFEKLSYENGWNLENSKLLDVGCGQGGAVLEALEREAFAYGIEPGAEFVKLSRMRLEEAGYDPNLIIEANAEELPFRNNSFDYVISLQVLEHVENPELILKEIYRILKPGGECWISCENYLSFREQHYRIRWFPLLPKFIGRKYLKMKGRNPHFFDNYVFYTTYPQIWRLCKKTGFQNKTYFNSISKIRNQGSFYVKMLSFLPNKLTNYLLRMILHSQNIFKVGVKVLLRKQNKEAG